MRVFYEQHFVSSLLIKKTSKMCIWHRFPCGMDYANVSWYNPYRTEYNAIFSQANIDLTTFWCCASFSKSCSTGLYQNCLYWIRSWNGLTELFITLCDHSSVREHNSKCPPPPPLTTGLLKSHAVLTMLWISILRCWNISFHVNNLMVSEIFTFYSKILCQTYFIYKCTWITWQILQWQKYLRVNIIYKLAGTRHVFH